jgi:hypothetical protein
VFIYAINPLRREKEDFMERGIKDIVVELGRIEGALMEKGCGAKLLKDSLVAVVEGIGEDVDSAFVEELNGVIGLIDSVRESLGHTAKTVESCQLDLLKIAEATA